MRYLHLLGIIVVAGLSGCTSKTAQKSESEFFEIPEKPVFSETELKTVDALPAILGSPNEIVLWEGMPHQFQEGQLLADELLKNKFTEIRGEKFYRAARSVEKDDVAPLMEMLSSRETHDPSILMKLCGGFHADYALQWKTPHGPVTVLVCFGCHELVMFGRNFSLQSDISQRSYGRLMERLRKYHKSRPSSSYSEGIGLTQPNPPPAPVRSLRGS
jgi:hypothetical protein